MQKSPPIQKSLEHLVEAFEDLEQTPITNPDTPSSKVKEILVQHRDIESFVEAMTSLIDAEVQFRTSPAEMRDSKKSGVLARRKDLERTIRKMFGVSSGSTTRMLAVKDEEE